MRLDSIAIICENPKTSEPISSIEFELIKKFLKYNCDISSPSYRQTLLASIKKVIININ
jgi:hypothetical protein